MSTTKHPEYRDGAPCWVDLSTPDLAGAQRFYGSLFDWSFDAPNPAMGGYTNIRIGGQAIAGCMTKQPGDTSPSAWGVWLKSSNLEETARKVTAAGGRLFMPIHDVGDIGRMLLVIDPTGAFIGFWQFGTHRGAALKNVPGTMCWHELYTRDAAAADRFYAALFDYTTSAPLGAPQGGGDCPNDDRDGSMGYAVFNRDGEAVFGRMKMTATQFPETVPPHWLTHFAVADHDATAAKIRELGGKSLCDPIDTPYGRVSMALDPYGAAFAILQPASRAA